MIGQTKVNGGGKLDVQIISRNPDSSEVISYTKYVIFDVTQDIDDWATLTKDNFAPYKCPSCNASDNWSTTLEGTPETIQYDATNGKLKFVSGRSVGIAHILLNFYGYKVIRAK